jgi:hypothetical protein
VDCITNMLGFDFRQAHPATEALLLVAEHGGPTMLAQIGVMRALNRHVQRVFDTSRKDHHWGRRKLARDRWRKPVIIAGSILTGVAESDADDFGKCEVWGRCSNVRCRQRGTVRFSAKGR